MAQRLRGGGSRSHARWLRPATGAAIDLESLESALTRHGVTPADTDAERVLVLGRGSARHDAARSLRADGCAVTELDVDATHDVTEVMNREGFSRLVRAGVTSVHEAMRVAAQDVEDA